MPDEKTGRPAFGPDRPRLTYRDFRRDFLARPLERFFGTFWPAALASDNPIAIACLRLFTFRPDRPLLKVPDLRFFIAR